MKSATKIIEIEVQKYPKTNEQIRKDWDEIFKQAIAKGDVPENDMFERMKNIFDDSDW